MKGLKRHTHEERRRVVEELVPLVRRKFGANLVALAATSSYARGEDADYSDLELTAFVSEMPAGKPKGGMGRIRDGMLVELVWMTRETYIETTKEVTGQWYLAGSDTLVPVINAEFVEELNAYRVENLKEKCLARAAAHWHEVQEATGKVLNAAEGENREGFPLLFADMMRGMLISLSFLNRTPFVTFARFVSQARAFGLKPASFDALLDALVCGEFQDLPKLRATAEGVFDEFEEIFAALGVELYDDNVDPNHAPPPRVRPGR